MEEVGIKIKVDGSSVPAETAKVNQSLQGVGDQAEKYLKSLMTEYQLLGKTASEIAAYTAKQQGLSSEVQRQAKLIGEKIDLYHRQEAAAKQLAQTQDAAERRELAALNAQISARERYMNSLTQQNATTGMTWGQKKLYDAEQMGFNPTQMAQVKQHIADIEAKTAAATAAANKYGAEGSAAMKKMGQASEISAGQTRNAMRMLPMQMTDVVTQLAGGQNPLLILIQQGGQVKDSFGGIGPAIKGIGAALNPVTLGISAAAIAAGVLTYAFYKGGQEVNNYNKAIAMSGNVSGVTALQLQRTAENVSRVTSTQGAAADALAQMARSGDIASGSLERYATVALKMEKIVGISVEQTVANLSALAKNPTEASKKLDEQYHYLTRSIYDQIRALESQGRNTEAAALAQNTYTTAMAASTQQIAGNLSNLERNWARLSGEAKKAWDNMLGVNRQKDPLAIAKAALANAQAQSQLPQSTTYNGMQVGGAAAAARLPQLQQEVADLEALERINKKRSEINAAAARTEAAAKAFSDEKNKYKSKEAKQEDEIARLTNLAKEGQISDAERDKAIADAKKSFAGASKKNPQIAIDKSTLNFDLEQIKASAAEMIGAYDNAEKIMQARRSANLINEDEYYASKLSFINLNSQAQEDALTKEIARLGKENLSGKEKIDNDKKVVAVEKELAKVRADTTTKIELAGIAHVSANDKVTKSYQDAITAAQVYIDTVARQNARDIDGIGKGTRYRSEQSGINQIDDKYITKKQSLNDDLRRGDIDQDKFDKYAAIADDAYAKEVAAYNWRNDQIKAKEGDWLTGANEAFANYQDSAKNVAKSTEDLFTNGFKGMEDAAVKFATTGKFSIKDLVNSAIADFARMGARQAISGLAGVMGGGGFAGLLGNLGGSVMSLFGTPAGGGSGLAGAVGPTSEWIKPSFSAAGGFDIPSGINPIVQAHAEEMILPAQISRPLKAMLANGGATGASGEMHLHISPTIDARGADAAALARLEGLVATMVENFRPMVLDAVRGEQLKNRQAPGF